MMNTFQATTTLTPTVGGISRLGVWMIRLGIRPMFIEPGRPDQNGRHERFHETLKAETANPPYKTIRTQQAAFSRFQSIYNEERPHEALDMQVPAEVYAPSRRTMPSRLPQHEYSDDFAVRQVRKDGTMKWAGGYVFIGDALVGESIGLEHVDDDVWIVHLGCMQLGVLHERSRVVIPLPKISE